MLVEDCVLIEAKAVDHILPIHKAQLLSYMKLLNVPLGLLINFNVTKTRRRRLAPHPPRRRPLTTPLPLLPPVKSGSLRPTPSAVPPSSARHSSSAAHTPPAPCPASDNPPTSAR
ncbi:MAG TPA: GxxExxY protein [Opitutus sp.]|nr:GxxExxY protein [Opitutus sp.]